jgi:hypothetical protein
MRGRTFANDLDPSGSQGAEIVARAPLGLAAAAAIVEVLDAPLAGMRHDQRRGIGAGPARSCREIIEASVAQFSNVQKV